MTKPIALYAGQKQQRKVRKKERLLISKNTTNIREAENINFSKKEFALNVGNEKSTLVINHAPIAEQKILHTINNCIKKSTPRISQGKQKKDCAISAISQ